MKKLFGLFLTLALACCLCFALTACGDESEGSGAPTVEISEDGYWVINGEKTEYVTDKDGKIILSFKDAGKYIISAK